MDQARFETMNDQLASAGAPTEPRNGLDPDLLSQTLSALGLCGQGLQEPLRADPPRALGSTVEQGFWALDGMMVQVSGFRLAADHEKA